LQAICCSCFIPVYGGFVYPTFRGEIYIDGGASNNQPVIDMDTITVSPFSGETDICPADEESASLFEWNFAGTSIRLTTNNLYRVAVCLFPPSAEECASMCRSGFRDAVKFLISNGFASKAVCFSVEADLSADLTRITSGTSSTEFCLESSVHHNQLEQSRKAAIVLARVPTSSCLNLKIEKVKDRSDIVAGSTQLPHSLQIAFDEALGNGGFLGYIRSFRVVKLANYATLPLTTVFQLLKFCQCLSSWLAIRITKHIIDDWYSMRIKHLVEFIINELDAQGAKVSARLSQQLAITEFEFSGIGQRPVVREQVLDISLSSEAIKEREALQNMDRLLSKKSIEEVCQLSREKTDSFTKLKFPLIIKQFLDFL
uniref:PNPLA domain-containing protein n=1 Tax=Thelazia callipaeda TaxID=103827 RepID=A0A0N5CLE0_THECL